MASSSTLHHHVVDSISATNSRPQCLPAAVSRRLAPVITAGARRRSTNSAKLRLIKPRDPAAPLRACAPTTTNIAPAATTTDQEPAEGIRAGSCLRVGIVGFGNFGQFIARGLQRQGHAVLAASTRSDYSGYCRQHGIEFFASVDDLCAEQPDVVLICSSILSAEGVLRSIPTHKLRPDTIFADVLSVKQFPRNLFLEVLPPEFGILCTHPMFGPESGKHGWTGLPFVYDKVRIADGGAQANKCAQFLGIFQGEGCRMVEMSCEEHDRHAAGSQFITHTIGRKRTLSVTASTSITASSCTTSTPLTRLRT